MPEAVFTIRWPDGSNERCYSPSSIVASYLQAGQTLPLATFHDRARAALLAASDRVERKYGHACSRALAQLARLEEQVARFADHADPQVTCLTLSIGGECDG